MTESHSDIFSSPTHYVGALTVPGRGGSRIVILQYEIVTEAEELARANSELPFSLQAILRSAMSRRILRISDVLHKCVNLIGDECIYPACVPSARTDLCVFVRLPFSNMESFSAIKCSSPAFRQIGIIPDNERCP
jgi:hypothetical protein